MHYDKASFASLFLFFSVFLSFDAVGKEGENLFRDPRDNQVYGTESIGKLTWMTSNLRHKKKGSICYSHDEKLCESLGRLYRFESAQNACPMGWHLATDDDWLDLERALGIPQAEEHYNDYNKPRGNEVGRKLKKGGSSLMEFPISGFGYQENGKWTFDGISGDRPRSYFWTSTKENMNGETFVYRRRIEEKNDSIFRFSNPVEGYAISVRCVKGF